MDSLLALKLENKAKVVQECNSSLKQQRLSDDDRSYTLRVKEQCLAEIKSLLDGHPELNHHPTLLKISMT